LRFSCRIWHAGSAAWRHDASPAASIQSGDLDAQHAIPVAGRRLVCIQRGGDDVEPSNCIQPEPPAWIDAQGRGPGYTHRHGRIFGANAMTRPGRGPAIEHMQPDCARHAACNACIVAQAPPRPAD
jgi:hypothetical protein